MLYGLVIAIHVIVSLVLIFVILLQAGRGGGLSESFGGGSSTSTIFGTKTSLFLRRATEVAAIVYILTCLTLAVMTSHKGRSLVGGGVVRPYAGQAQQGVPQPMAPLPDDMVDF